MKARTLRLQSNKKKVEWIHGLLLFRVAGVFESTLSQKNTTDKMLVLWSHIHEWTNKFQPEGNFVTLPPHLCGVKGEPMQSCWTNPDKDVQIALNHRPDHTLFLVLRQLKVRSAVAGIQVPPNRSLHLLVHRWVNPRGLTKLFNLLWNSSALTSLQVFTCTFDESIVSVYSVFPLEFSRCWAITSSLESRKFMFWKRMDLLKTLVKKMLQK